ncbi:MAG TPA: hypothetical protein VKG84_07420 [Candidatus Acidoferrales bacterium]|nr:hypothetical protein [Candidatus Acidoferrales bacterium]
MRATHNRLHILALAVAGSLLFAAPSLHAQQGSGQGAGQPAPADVPQVESGAPQNAPGPLGGAEAYRIPEGGGLGLGHSFVVPRFSLQEVYDTNTGFSSTTGASQGDAITTLQGGLNLQVQKRNSTFSLDYSAAGLIYGLQTQPNSVVQQFAATQKFTMRRWNFFLAENLSYLPNTQFGLSGLGYLTGGGTSTLNPSFQTGSTIGSMNAYQLTNTTIAQAQYMLDERSSLTVSGNLGILHYSGDGLLDSRSVTARVAYDRTLTARDTVNVSYAASVQSYSSGAQGFISHYIQPGYRRYVTGRLFVSVSAGPVINHFSPQPGQTTVQGSQNAVSLSVAGALDYAIRNGSIKAQYTRGTTGGSGVLVGSTTDQLSGSFTRRFTRVWTVAINGSYARNSSFQQTQQPGMMSATSTFDYWNAGMSFSRPLGHYSSVRFSYNAQSQTSNVTSCVNGVQCGPISLVQVVGLSFNWSTRPYKLD